MTSTETSLADDGTVRAATPRSGRPGRRDAARVPEPEPEPQTQEAAGSSASGRRWADELPDPTVDPRPGSNLERAVWAARQKVVQTEKAYEAAKETCATAEQALREHRAQVELREITEYVRRLRPEERALLRQMQEDRGVAEELLGALRTRQLKGGDRA